MEEANVASGRGFTANFGRRVFRGSLTIATIGEEISYGKVSMHPVQKGIRGGRERRDKAMPLLLRPLPRVGLRGDEARKVLERKKFFR